MSAQLVLTGTTGRSRSVDSGKFVPRTDVGHCSLAKVSNDPLHTRGAVFGPMADGFQKAGSDRVGIGAIGREELLDA